MKSEESSANETTSEAKKLENKRKNRFAQIARGSNSYASLPNYGSSSGPMKGGRATSVVAAANMSGQDNNPSTDSTTSKRQTSNRNKNNNNKEWLNMTTSTSSTTTTPVTTITTIATIAPAKIHDTEVAHKKLPPYMNLDDESCDDDDHSFGLSNDLSTESIKKACERYDDDDDDDVSDDDLIETHHTPHSFQKSNPMRRSWKQQTALTIDRRRKRRKLDEHPLCTLPRSSSSSLASPLGAIPAQTAMLHTQTTNVGQDEVTDVLNELDAILNGHSASCSMQNALSTAGETKIEDCLLDLDNYLDGIDDDGSSSFTNEDDCELSSTIEAAGEGEEERGLEGSQNKERRNRTLPKNLYVFPGTCSPAEDVENRLQLGHKLRRTISSDMKIDGLRAASPSSSTPTKCLSSAHATEWRRNSMRNTLPLLLPPPPTSKDEANTAVQIADVSPRESALREAAALDSTQRVSATNELRRCHSQSSVAEPSALTNRTLAWSLSNPDEMLTAANIFQNILLVQSEAASSESRPRQFGRRALDASTGRVLTMHADALDTNNCMIRSSVSTQRPMSAPATAVRHLSGSEHSSLGSSRNASPVSLVSNSSTDDSSSTTTLNATPTHAQSSHADGCRTDANPGATACDTPLDPDNIQLLTQLGNNSQWPHSFSRILALLCCSLGLFNICRFAVLTVQYGGNFLLQFLLLSVIFGIPLFWLQMCLGAKIKAGPVTMWKISPICKGIGIALTLLQALLTIYSSIAVAWVLIYLRDSFLEKAHPLYRWQEPYFSYRHNTNSTANLTETVADYFNGFVLQRLQMVRRSDITTVRFQVNDRLAFNLALIWTFVFLVLCKGLKSYGKVVLGLAIIPLVTLIVVTCKLLTVIDFTTLQNIFSAADFEDFLINSKTWSAAAQEAFLTWGLWGPSVIAMSSRLHANAQSKDVLRRDAILVVVTTLFGLSLASLFGLACVQILNENYFIYIPGSYEHMESYMSVYSLKAPLNTALISFPTKWVPHYSSLLGETYRRPTTVANVESGYQALRLISELFPAAMALCTKSVSWVWVAIILGMFLLFGLAQMCAMWKPISSALGNSTSSVLLSCVTGLLLSIPFSTEIGITEVYFMDLVVGGSWFLPILWTGLIFGVFLIRGRPYNGDDLVNDLRMSGSMSAFLALSWNVLLPIGLITLAIVEYKISNSNQLYHWRGNSYFSLWARKLAGLLQIAFMMIVPITALFQILIYLTSGPPDILDRIQLLYRPSQTLLDARVSSSTNGRNNSNNTRNGPVSGLARNIDAQAHPTLDDAPPKYTPPPSYTTATGARLAKILRQSIRRSVRRLINIRTRTELSLDTTDQASLPPDYAALHMSENIEIGQRSPVDSNYQQRALSLGRNIHLQKLTYLESMDREQQRPSSAAPSTEHHHTHHLSRDRPAGRPYTAADVATILRSSTRRGTERRTTQIARGTTRRDDEVVYEDDANCSSYSAENLILNAEPLGESAAIAAVSMERDEEESQRSCGGSTEENNVTVI